MKLILASAFIQGCTSCITLLFPYACGHVLDMSIIKSSSETSHDSFSPSLIAFGLIGLTALAGLGVYTRSLLLNTAGNRIVSRMRRRVFASIVSQDASFFDAAKIGDLISRLTNDSQHIESVVTTEIVLGIRGLVMTFVSTALLFYTSFRLAIISLFSIPPVFVTAKIVGRTLSEKQKEVQELHGEAIHVADQVFSGIQTVQQFVTENHEWYKYSKAINKAHDKEIRVGKTKAAFDAIVYV
jgi:ATP-binding cassette subfamily B protein